MRMRRCHTKPKKASAINHNKRVTFFIKLIFTQIMNLIDSIFHNILHKYEARSTHWFNSINLIRFSLIFLKNWIQRDLFSDLLQFKVDHSENLIDFNWIELKSGK